MEQLGPSTVVTWLVPLEGHQFDLEDLPSLLAGSPVSVVVRDDVCCLVIPVELIGDGHDVARVFAEQQIAQINGAARLLWSSSRPVRATDTIFGLDSMGKTVSTVLAVTGGEFRMKGGVVSLVTSNEDPSEPQAGAAAEILAAAARSPAARDALTMLGRPTVTWSELYIVFELVQADVGSRIYELGWVSKSRARWFTRTANSYMALGLAGRHGKDRGAPPRVPMSLGEATTLVHDLVRNWIGDVAGRNSE